VLRMMAGVEEPSSGAITFNNTAVGDLSPHERLVSLVSQELALFPHMTVTPR
jgi:ABC-type Fe3+/spermidine/putrescine transport system ATPase subunit